MYGLYGIISYGLDYVYDKIKLKCDKEDLSFYMITGKEEKDLVKIHKVKILLIPSFLLFKRYAEELKKSKAIVVIVDHPLHLSDIDGLIMLDAKTDEGKRYSFRMHKIDWKNFFKEVLSIDSRIDFSIKDLELIPTMIKNQSYSDFLDTYTTLLYKCFDTKRRNIAIPIIFKRMFGGDHKEFLQEMKRFRLNTEFGKSLMNKFITSIESEYGNKLVSALKEASSLNTKIKNYIKIADKYKVNIYDLRFLIKSRAKWKTVRPVGSMQDVIKFSMQKNTGKLDKVKKRK